MFSSAPLGHEALVMIDKLELIVMHDAPFRRQIANLYRTLRLSHNSSRGLYGAALDLRQFGSDAILRLEHKRYGTHKIELLNTGKKTMTELCATLERIIDKDPLSHRVSRIDLAVDIPDYPLEWFRTHVRVQFKQWKCVLGRLRVEQEFSEMGKKEYQTLYFGKRPSCLRIYDKVEERRCEYELRKKREARKAKRCAVEDSVAVCIPEFPSFEEWLAVNLNLADSRAAQPQLVGMEQPRQLAFPVITRVENQLGGSAIRRTKLTSIAGVINDARDFNPFARIQIVSGARRDPGLYDRMESGKYRYTVTQYFGGMYLREHWNDFGAGGFAVVLNRDRNRRRLLEYFGDFLPFDDRPSITAADLYERYRSSISRQLAS